MWVLKNKENGKYVAKSGAQHSYTSYFKNAEKFETREKALENSCKESEYPVKVNSDSLK